MLEGQLHEQATKDARELAEARLKIFELEMERAGAPPEQRAPGFSGVVEEALRASRREAAADRRETNRLKFRCAANAVHAARAAAPMPSPGFAVCPITLSVAFAFVNNFYVVSAESFHFICLRLF